MPFLILKESASVRISSEYFFQNFLHSCTSVKDFCTVGFLVQSVLWWFDLVDNRLHGR